MNRTININYTLGFPYWFGFNGMEKDDEISGVTGANLDFGAREYDSRIGRWWAALFMTFQDKVVCIFELAFYQRDK